MKTDDKIYFYDGTFINLLSLIKILIKNKIKPLDIKDENTYNYNLIDQTYKMHFENCEKIINEIINKMSSYAFRMIYYVFLSCEEYKELIIYYFILNGLNFGKKIIYYRKLKCVCEVLRISKYVSYEAHRLKGFVRFKANKNNYLFASIEPTNNVIGILSQHFSLRLRNEVWIIKDAKRNIMSIYDKRVKKYYIVNCDEVIIKDFILSEEEKDYEDLWKTFFNTIAIKERTNRRCQMNFMPKKYWKYILEMENNYE